MSSMLLQAIGHQRTVVNVLCCVSTLEAVMNTTVIGIVRQLSTRFELDVDVPDKSTKLSPHTIQVLSF